MRRVTGDLRLAFPPAKAVALFEDTKPGDTMIRVNDRILARLFGLADQYEDAAALLEKLIETYSDGAERAVLLQELGAAHQMAGNPERARWAYEEALKYSSDNWITLNNLAYLLSDQLDESKAARPYAERAVALADNPHTLDTLGWIYVGLGEYSPAIAELSRAVRLDPSVALSYYHLGEAYRRNGQVGEAGEILRSGRDLARTAGDSKLIVLFDASLERVENSDTVP
jgi:tetratricopeptide (TPR) repeat protein